MHVKSCSGVVRRVENTDIKNWFTAMVTVNGVKCMGYGMNTWAALDDAFRDYWVGWRLTEFKD